MVSQLSERLLMPRTYPSGYNSTAASGTSGSTGSSDNSKSSSSSSTKSSAKNDKKRGEKRAPSYSTMAPSVGGSSGYVADRNAEVFPLPVCIDLLSRLAKRGEAATATSATAGTTINIPTNRSKRPKPSVDSSELNYMARTAKEDLARGGIFCPKIQVHRPRIFPPRSGVDMSTVSLLFSDDANVRKTPFLASPKTKENRHHYMECPFQLMAMIQATSDHYRPSSEERLPPIFTAVAEKMQVIESQQQWQENEKDASSYSGSATSSLSISDAGLEAGISARDSAWDDAPPTSTKKGTLTPNSAVIPMGEALAITHHPRIITFARKPFNVVQVNAAFHRLTDSNSADFLGKPLHELTVDGTLIEALKESAASRQAVTVNVPGHTFQKTKQHTFTVSPVGATGKDASITHFAIKLSGNEPPTPTVSAGSRNTSNVPISVMG